MNKQYRRDIESKEKNEDVGSFFLSNSNDNSYNSKMMIVIAYSFLMNYTIKESQCFHMLKYYIGS